MRSKPTRRPWLSAAAILLLCPLAASDQSFAQGEEVDDWRKETEQVYDKVAAGSTLRVVNPYGNVYVRFGGYENQVEVLSTFQRFDADGTELAVVRTLRDDGGLSVQVTASGDNAADPNDRVDIVVFVPAGVGIQVETVDDQIESRGLKSDFAATSVKGEIRVRGTAGRVSARSERGLIVATLETGATKERQEFVTVTGAIEVYVGEDADLNVDLGTSGEISTDFSIEIEHHRFEEPGKIGRAVIGEGGPVLSLQSRRGAVKLLRMQKDFRLGS